MFHQIITKYYQIKIFFFVLACVVYSNTIGNKWAIDDKIVISENRYTQRGISGLDSLFLKGTFHGYFGDHQIIAGDRWRPLTPIFFAIQAEFFANSLKDDKGEIIKDSSGFTQKDLKEDTLFPNILHFMNVVLFGLLCIILYEFLLILLNPNQSPDFRSNFITFTATLLFTLHPIHTEAVANVKGLDEILSLLGSLLSGTFLLKAFYFQEHKNKWLILASVSYFLGLLSKETAITFIAIFPLIFFIFTNANRSTIFKFTLPLFIILFVFLGIRTSIVGYNFRVENQDMLNQSFLQLNPDAKYTSVFENSSIKKLVKPDQNTYFQMPYSNQLATIFYSNAIYLRLLILPISLTTDYYPRHIQIKNITDFSVVLSIMIHLALIILAIYFFSRKSIFSFSIIYYFITISIVSNFFFPIGTNLSERFLFMPSVGFCLLFALSIEHIYQKIKNLNIILSVILLSSTFYFYQTLTRNWDWKNNFTLLSNDILISKNSAKMNCDYASVIYEKANQEFLKELKEASNLPFQEQDSILKKLQVIKNQKIKELLPYLEKAIEIHPIYSAAWTLYGTIYYNFSDEFKNPIQRFSDTYISMVAYEQAYNFMNNNEIVRNNLARGYKKMGILMGEQYADFQKAVFFLQKSIQINSKDPEAYMILGTAYSSIENYLKAIEYTELSLKLKPDNFTTQENLAILYQNIGKKENDRNWFLKAENILLKVLDFNEKLDDSPQKTKLVLRTLVFLRKNYDFLGKSNQKLEIENKIKSLEK